MQFHEIANIFPLMEGNELIALVADIKENGLLEPIITHEGKIVDGRNRYRACVLAEVEPRFEEWKSNGKSLLDWVISKNLHRRHLNESQRAIVAARIANKRREDTLIQNQSDAQICASIGQDEAAEMLNVSRRSVQSAKVVLDEGVPELIKTVDNGAIPVSQAAAIAKMNKKDQKAIVKNVESGKTPAAAIREKKHEEKRSRELPKGKFAVIYADPPWEYKNSGFSEAADNKYPTMPIDEICELPVSELAEDSSVLFLWATNPLLPEALRVVKAWGFEYVTNMAWIKDAGRGKGWFLKSKHELLIIGRKKDTPHPIERPDSCFEADRGSVHSRKPEKAYEIIESMYSGSKIELFARSQRNGWESWGNEVE